MLEYIEADPLPPRCIQCQNDPEEESWDCYECDYTLERWIPGNGALPML